MRHADGCIRISPEARTDWRREAEASVEFLSEHNTTPPLKDWPVTGRESGAGRFVLDQRNRRPGAPHDDFIHSISRRSRRRPAWRGQLAVQPAAELHAIDRRKLPDHCIAAARMIPRRAATPDERIIAAARGRDHVRARKDAIMTTMNCFIDIETRSGRKLRDDQPACVRRRPEYGKFCASAMHSVTSRGRFGFRTRNRRRAISPRPGTIPPVTWSATTYIRRDRHRARAWFPSPIPLERLVDTMARARARSLPAGLDLLTRALGLEHQKDMTGKRAMLALAKPRKARIGDDPAKIYFEEDPESSSISTAIV